MADVAKMGEATKSPTMKAEDSTPSSKLLKLNCPLYATSTRKKNNIRKERQDIRHNIHVPKLHSEQVKTTKRNIATETKACEKT